MLFHYNLFHDLLTFVAKFVLAIFALFSTNFFTFRMYDHAYISRVSFDKSMQENHRLLRDDHQNPKYNVLGHAKGQFKPAVLWRDDGEMA